MLSACSGGDGNNMTSGRGGVANSKLTLNITDAAVDQADAVWVEFTGVTLHLGGDIPNKDDLVFEFDTPKRIDLHKLQGVNATELLDQQIIPAGDYEWIRLHVNAQIDGVNDSSIIINGAEYELYIPSGYQSGLKLNHGFQLIPNAEFNYTIDFDLRKSVVETTPGDYTLRPSLRMVNSAQSATIIGTVQPGLVSSLSCSDLNPETGNAVYLFDQHNTVPDDIDGIGVEPVSSAIVTLDGKGDYSYTLGYIAEGDYTIAFTCDADLDTADKSEAIDFSSTFNISVNAGDILKRNF